MRNAIRWTLTNPMTYVVVLVSTIAVTMTLVQS